MELILQEAWCNKAASDVRGILVGAW